MENIPETMSIPEIKEAVNILQDIYERFQMVSLGRQLEATKALLAQEPPIDVAVLGQFKAGKSSFLNSLLEQDVLPVGVIPVTTAITRLQYGKEPRVVVKHFDGSTAVRPLADIAEFTSEAKNPDNKKNVAIVNIELPSLEKYSGIRLVDTPGLGSVYKYHQSTSESWLPEVGTAILAVSADRPLSEDDLELIRELTTHTPNIIILLTKADLLSPQQQNEVIEFFKQTLQRELNRVLPVYLYSTTNNTQSYRQRIEGEILQKINTNRDFEFLRILRHKTRFLTRSVLNYLDIALSTSLKADQNRADLRAQILNEKVNENVIRDELGLIARENQQQTRSLIQSYLEKFQAQLTIKEKARLAKELPTWKGNLWKLSRKYEEWVSDTMSEEMRLLSKTEHHNFYGTLKKAHAGFSRSLEIFRKFLGENIQKVLGVQLADIEWKIDVAEPDHPDIAFTKSFDIHLDLIWFLIPMFIFRKFFERHFIKGLPREVEINISRLAYQWEKGINAAIEAMRVQAVTYVQEELATIEALLSQTKGQTEEIRQLIAKVKEQAKNLAA
jgi:GTP-binding protein EngB required for normal cell division